MEVSLKDNPHLGKQIFSDLPETNIENSHLKMDGLKILFFLLKEHKLGLSWVKELLVLGRVSFVDFWSSTFQVVKMKQAAMAAAAEFTWSNAALQYEAVFQELGVKDVLNGHLVWKVDGD